MSVQKPINGGTGINNANTGTLSLSGPFSIIGMFSLDVLLTASSSITMPLSGTLITDTGAYSDPAWLVSLDFAKLINTSSQIPVFNGLSLLGTNSNLGLNSLTTAQFDAQSPVQGSIAFDNDYETIIMFDGQLDQLLATRNYLTANYVSLTGSYANPSWITSLAAAKVTGLAPSATTDTTNASNITSGLLSGAVGGTGVNNTGKTITLGGNLTTSGANAVTLTTTGATNVTLPTSGTLATAAGSVPSLQGTANSVLVNGTSGSPVSGSAITLSTPQFIGTTSTPTFGALTVAGAGSALTFNNTTAGVGQVIAPINFIGNNASAGQVFYAQIKPTIESATTGAEAAKLDFFARNPVTGLAVSYLTIDGLSQQVTIASPLYMNKIMSGKWSADPITSAYIDYDPAQLGDFGSGLTTVQPIDTTATPTFYGLTLNDSGLYLFNTVGGIGTPIGFDITGSVDNLGNSVDYSYQYTQIEDDTPGATKASEHFFVRNGGGGAATEFLRLDGTTSTVSAYKPVRLTTEVAGGIVYTDSNKDLRAVASPTSYTPTIGDGTNNFTASSAIGKYYQAGNIIWYQLYIAWTSKGSASGGAQVRISLPATIGANSPRCTAAPGYVQGVGWTGVYAAFGGQTGQSYLNVFGISNNGSAVFTTVALMGTSGEMQLNGFFWIN